MNEKNEQRLPSQKKVIESSIHHTYKQQMTEDEQKIKTYFARLRGYRNRK